MSKKLFYYPPSFADQYSMLMDGADEYITVGNNFGFQYNNTFSFSFWYKRNAFGVTHAFFGKQAAGGTLPGYSMTHALDNKLYFILTNTVANRIIVNSTSAYTGGGYESVFHNIVFTYDGSHLASGVTIYLDGSAIALTTSQNTLGTNTIQNAVNVEIGARAAQFPMNGYMDEVSVWNKELTAGDVTSIYNGGSPNNLSGHSSVANLVEWWRMGEGATYAAGVWTIPGVIGGVNGSSVNMEVGDRTTTVP